VGRGLSLDGQDDDGGAVEHVGGGGYLLGRMMMEARWCMLMEGDTCLRRQTAEERGQRASACVGWSHLGWGTEARDIT